MLIAPLVIGAVHRSRVDQLPAWLPTLTVTWLAGYFCFNAATLAAKSAPRRRPALRRPLAMYAAIAILAGMSTLLLGGWALLWWLPCYAVLVVPALVLAARRQDRSLISGLLTVTAASLILPAVWWTTPQHMVQTASTAELMLVLGVWTYFAGTVFHVKSMIRKKGSRRWWLTSVAFHLIWMAVFTLARTITGWWWVVFFALATLRAIVLPQLGLRMRIRPLYVGLLEIALSGCLLVISVL